MKPNFNGTGGDDNGIHDDEIQDSPHGYEITYNSPTNSYHVSVEKDHDEPLESIIIRAVAFVTGADPKRIGRDFWAQFRDHIESQIWDNGYNRIRVPRDFHLAGVVITVESPDSIRIKPRNNRQTNGW